jgi:16S rRNA processing protein RimM
MSTHSTIGRFGTAHGVSGWLKVISFTIPAENILHYQPWLISVKNEYQPLQVTATKANDSLILVKLAGCNTREDAKKFTNIEIKVPRSVLPTLSQDEFYWTDLEGLTVITPNGQVLGTVDYLFESGANDILVLIDRNNKQKMVPYIKDVIIKVDLLEKQIIADWDPEF